MKIEDIISFIVVGVLIRGVLLPFISKLIVRLLKRLFIKTEREMQIWLHYYHGKHLKRQLTIETTKVTVDQTTERVEPNGKTS